MAKIDAKKPFLERIGLQYFRRLSGLHPGNFSPDEIHVLNLEERKNLLRIQKYAVIRASIAGGISAGLSVLGGILLEPLFAIPEDAPFLDQLPYFGAIMGITVIVTTLEIVFLYFDALRTVHKLSTTAGLELFPEKEEGRTLATALVRAALELPNPPDDIEGINPRREVSRFRLVIGTIIYKLKASATNFIVKAVVRKIVGRSGFRAWMEMTAVPVFAAWNAMIAWWVFRQARIRAMGPSAASDFVGVICRDLTGISDDAKKEAFRAVGASIVRSADLHPNLVSMMEILEQHLGDPGNIVMDDSELFLEKFRSLEGHEQIFVMKILAIAAVIDGKFRMKEKQLLYEAMDIAGLERDLSRIQRIRKAFVAGRDIADEEITRCIVA